MDDSAQYLKGVGPVKFRLFSGLGIETVRDLLYHFPRDYYDRRQFSKIGSLPVGEPVTFLGMVQSWNIRRLSRGRTLLTVAVGDDSGYIPVVLFNQPYLARSFKTGRKLVVSGEVQYYGGRRQVVSPDFEFLSDELDQNLVQTGRIVPIYPLTKGISQHWLRRVVLGALNRYESHIPENLPESLQDRHGFLSRASALRSVHFPESHQDLKRARQRLRYEELFDIQIFTIARRRRKEVPTSFPVRPKGELWRRFLDGLPFRLTGGQAEVLEALESDFEKNVPVHRLLQGEVGSGKTVVALGFLLRVIESGYQAAFMAPTEVLAVQHHRSLTRYLEGLEISHRLLLGATKAAEKREIQAELAEGRVSLVVGTHALIQDAVSFDRLGAAVIDEQHRFGVRQRATLIGADDPPHLLVMTATPIPRTLAMTAYGDLDLAIVRGMPPGRSPVRTTIAKGEQTREVMDFVREQVGNGRQAYFLYPLVEETEKQDLLAAKEEYEALASRVFPDLRVGLIHGRMSYEDKDEVMSRFRSGAIQILVCTTVVEVGIDVPNATIMVIHNPERFGLSQLHQLRGRIGRGSHRGSCILLLDRNVGGPAFRRLRIFAENSDGFKIAEEDLRIRGPGELWGTRQHGQPGFKLVNPVRDADLVERVHRDVMEIFREDPALARPENRPVAGRLARHLGERGDLMGSG